MASRVRRSSLCTSIPLTRACASARWSLTCVGASRRSWVWSELSRGQLRAASSVNRCCVDLSTASGSPGSAREGSEVYPLVRPSSLTSSRTRRSYRRARRSGYDARHATELFAVGNRPLPGLRPAPALILDGEVRSHRVAARLDEFFAVRDVLE